MKLNILNIRKSFATNSSSTHSILYLDNLNEKIASNNIDSDFGWDFFTISNDTDKIHYLASCVQSYYYAQNCLLDIEYEEKIKIANEATYKIFPELNGVEFKSVDHQSQLLIPDNFDGTNLNIEYIQDLKQYLLNNNVVIVGGNDNTDQEHDLLNNSSYKKSVLSEIPTETNNWVARKTKSLDKFGNEIKDSFHWVLFDKSSGRKIRFNFDDKKIVEKSYAPELADICITSWCNFGCEYCYQDSTINGRHADLKDIEFIAKSLSEKEVLEVAAGGGEPTLHPNFKEIAKIFHKNNIVFNFTTKNLSFFKKQENEDFIVNYIGAFAFSVSSIDDLEKLIYLSQTKPKIKNKITAQYVMGTTDEKDFEEILKLSYKNNITITLLGYKEIGRGNNFKPYNYDNWLDIIKKLREQDIYTNINIDTKLSGDYKKILEKNKISMISYHTTEGAHSVYIDCVEKTMLPSSYIGFEQKQSFDENWIKNYSKYYIDVAEQKKVIKIKK